MILLWMKSLQNSGKTLKFQDEMPFLLAKKNASKSGEKMINIKARKYGQTNLEWNVS
jgi:hypothetical protein